MFGWLKKQARNEQLKLLFQNHGAARFLSISFDAAGASPDITQRVQEFEAQNRRIANCEKIEGNDLKLLLEINRELRAFFDYYEKAGPEARLREAFGQPPASPRRFDDIFKPVLGWNDYYNRSGG